jgi:hypothetical protein
VSYGEAMATFPIVDLSAQPPEPNRNDPEECDLCAYVDDICIYHLGVMDGWEAASRNVHQALEDPESVVFPRERI